ncbi:FXSXX-COOH protein [Actinomadura craniellae]|uniref:FXSXX-COOH protein n=1 Tax=Actinomadura craniellae TaxID=2231787 RepID=A0A365H3K6_9ACTN|nr:FxSxx-COOH cyclophane-containing RiPP peptide [Actinomadura craniellae]RAY12803.1 FXSXX-COOH protein [Actinomadura craniellae]
MRDEIESELFDLSALPLDRLRELDDTVLGAALERVQAEAEKPGKAVSGFDSII